MCTLKYLWDNLSFFQLFTVFQENYLVFSFHIHNEFTISEMIYSKSMYKFSSDFWVFLHTVSENTQVFKHFCVKFRPFSIENAIYSFNWHKRKNSMNWRFLLGVIAPFRKWIAWKYFLLQILWVLTLFFIDDWINTVLKYFILLFVFLAFYIFLETTF